MNDGWGEVRLGDLAPRLTEKNRGASTNVLTISARHGLVSQEEYFNKSVASRNLDKYFLLQRGDFAYNKSHSAGYPLGVVRRLERYESGVVSPLYICFRPNGDDRIDPDFLLHFFDGGGFDGELRQIAKQGARAHGLLNVKASEFFEMVATIPPLPEQKKIAEILGSVDEAIQATQAVIDQTRKVKQGLLQQLLTRGIGHTRFKQTEIGEIPESWEVVPGDSLCERISVGIVVKPAQYYVESGVRAFRSANVGEGKVKDRDWVYIDPAAHVGAVRKSALRVGDVLVVRSGAPGTACVVPQDYADSNCIDVIFARPTVHRILPGFLAWFINSPEGKGQVLRNSGGLAQQHFNVGALKRMLIAVPPLAEQQSILERIESLMTQLATNEATLAATKRVKSGLMSDLLSGRVRVKVDA